MILRRRSIACCAIYGAVWPAIWGKSRLRRGPASRVIGTGHGAIVNSSACGRALVAKQQIDFLASEGKLHQIRERAALDLLRLELGLERLLRLPVSGMRSEKEQTYLRLRLVALQRHLTGCVGEIGPCLAPASLERLRLALDWLEQAIMALPADLEGIPRTSEPASPGSQTGTTEPPTSDNGRDEKSAEREDNAVEKQPEKKKLLE